MTFIIASLIAIVIFLIGVWFGSVGFAKLNCWQERLYSDNETYKSANNIIITKNNNECTKLKHECSDIHVRGFEHPNSEEEYYDDDDYDEEDMLKSHTTRKMGF
jgi:hypothetical protein